MSWKMLDVGHFVHEWTPTSRIGLRIDGLHLPSVRFYTERLEHQTIQVLRVGNKKVKRAACYRPEWILDKNSGYDAGPPRTSEDCLIRVALQQNEIIGKSRDAAVYNIFWEQIVANDVGRAWMRKQKPSVADYYTSAYADSLYVEGVHPGLAAVYFVWREKPRLDGRLLVSAEQLIAFARHFEKDPSLADAVAAMTLAHYPDGLIGDNLTKTFLQFIAQTVNSLTTSSVPCKE